MRDLKIFHFDQELLNVLFDGDYTELGEILNLDIQKWKMIQLKCKK